MEALKTKRTKPGVWAHLIYAFLILALGTAFVNKFLENHRLAGEISELKNRPRFDPVVVFFVESQATDFKVKPFIFQVNSLQNKHLQALQILFNGPAPGTGLMRLFPEGTKVLSFTLQDGLATVNLNRRVTELNAGSTLEALAVVSIVNTLTKFPDVYRVKILIEGKEVESLAGHVDLTTELHYSNIGVDPVPGEMKIDF